MKKPFSLIYILIVSVILCSTAFSEETGITFTPNSIGVVTIPRFAVRDIKYNPVASSPVAGHLSKDNEVCILEEAISQSSITTDTQWIKIYTTNGIMGWVQKTDLKNKTLPKFDIPFKNTIANLEQTEAFPQLGYTISTTVVARASPFNPYDTYSLPRSKEFISPHSEVVLHGLVFHTWELTNYILKSATNETMYAFSKEIARLDGCINLNKWVVFWGTTHNMCGDGCASVQRLWIVGRNGGLESIGGRIPYEGNNVFSVSPSGNLLLIRHDSRVVSGYEEQIAVLDDENHVLISTMGRNALWISNNRIAYRGVAPDDTVFLVDTSGWRAQLSIPGEVPKETGEEGEYYLPVKPVKVNIKEGWLDLEFARLDENGQKQTITIRINTNGDALSPNPGKLIKRVMNQNPSGEASTTSLLKGKDYEDETFKVETDPYIARIWVNGKDYGDSPATITVRRMWLSDDYPPGNRTLDPITVDAYPIEDGHCPQTGIYGQNNAKVPPIIKLDMTNCMGPEN